VHWDDLRRALAAHAPVRLSERMTSQAAVALVLREGSIGRELLFIRRAEHPRDRWSGQIGFPGGRAEPHDADLRATAERETDEELGLDLRQKGEPLGQLDEVRAMGRGGPVDLAITPFVFGLRGAADLTLSGEVTSVHWLGFDALLGTRHLSVFDYDHEGTVLRLPCFRVGELVIWGLTFRMFSNFRDIIAAARLPLAASRPGPEPQ
jgi:8-oxo-dGTP pyrophosphatase MutT (NUDIX family)